LHSPAAKERSIKSPSTYEKKTMPFDNALKPPHRRLKAYAFDPSLSLKIDTAEINNIIYKVPWEDKLEPGPVGEYIELIDFDPTTKKYYRPIDLNTPYVLAQDGYDPSESNPLFHQQMVYAVVMTTISNFEQALGRKIIWAPRRLKDQSRYEEYVPKLRIYPHAFRDANAYYSPVKKALLFGYFSSTPANEALHMPDSLVFTCLSHDIIAHETTHAILDGIHRLYNEPTNPDVLAFHEAFADIIALFQHFTFPEVLKNQIAKTRGDLASQNLLGQLAQEFSAAIGNYGSLRDAIGSIDPETHQWKMKEPSPDEYQTIRESHSRGSILVAAIFEAFINIYKDRVADLLRIASNGTGILPQGELHPDLVNRLANEASKTAGHVLSMCIRALDYCPPTDITFGDFLRALITADLDLVADDTRNYRLAFIDAFRKRGIYPEGIKTLSVESLAQPLVQIGINEQNDIPADSKTNLNNDSNAVELLRIILSFLRQYANEIKYVSDRQKIYEATNEFIVDSISDRHTDKGLHSRINQKFSRSSELERITGLAFIENPGSIGIRTGRGGMPSFQIQNLRLVSRVGPNGNQRNYVLFSIIQRSGLVFKDAEFAGYFTPPEQTDSNGGSKIPEGGFEFHGGCTLIFDLDSMQLKYAISKPLLDAESRQGDPQIDLKRAKRQYAFQHNEEPAGNNEYTNYFSRGIHDVVETFSFLHQS
jgi:hypothetical protein